MREFFMTERVIMAGSGGQGLMLIGKLLAHVVMREGKHVTFLPSYGTEVRGGTANCHVVISTEEIFSPFVEEADTLLIMNQQSYDKFKSILRPGGTLLVNSSMVHPAAAADGADLIQIPATECASELGNVRVANMVMAGAYNALKNLVQTANLLAELQATLAGKKAALFEINKKALERGEKFCPR
jgi:2-oxoglutarate ferredoxin oxidoreductase subunit gamma